MRKALSLLGLCLPLLLGAGQFGISTPLVTYVPPAGYNPCLISGWPMNEGTGLTLHDVSGNNNTATINTGSSVTWTTNTGFPGVTPYWNGTGYAVATSSSITNFTGSTPFSVAVWVADGSTLNTSQQIVGSADFTSPYGPGWTVFSNSSAGAFNKGAPVFNLINTISSNGIQIIAGLSTLNTAGAQYIVFTYDGSRTAAGVIMYNTGLSQVTAVGQNNLTSSTALAAPVYIGNDSGNHGPYTGAIAFLAIYNCVLTSTQVQSYYNAGPRIN